MSRKSILEAKQKAKETNELLEYLTDLIEKNDKRYSFVFGLVEQERQLWRFLIIRIRLVMF